ncbi:MAG: hypothetical protein IPK21_21640 [Haliscomenobacter sp.]|nr:hypothetical protein [Haliscomenobacter sp.]
MKTHFFRVSLLSLFAFFSCSASGQLRLPAVFGDHMVLQQKTDARIWGWGNSGSQIKVTGSWNNDTVTAKVANDGTWQLNLPTPAAGGPYTVTLLNDQKIVLEDVLIGEVWLCSGQSNMEWSANSGIVNAEAEVNNANHPNIRFSTSGGRAATTRKTIATGNGRFVRRPPCARSARWPIFRPACAAKPQCARRADQCQLGRNPRRSMDG